MLTPHWRWRNSVYRQVTDKWLCQISKPMFLGLVCSSLVTCLSSIHKNQVSNSITIQQKTKTKKKEIKNYALSVIPQSFSAVQPNSAHLSKMTYLNFKVITSFPYVSLSKTKFLRLVYMTWPPILFLPTHYSQIVF